MAVRPIPPWMARLLVGMAILGALGARLYGLQKGAVWYDEHFTLRVLAKDHWWQVADFEEKPDTHPPLFHALYHLSYHGVFEGLAQRSLAGRKGSALEPFERWLFRLPTALLGVMAVGLVYPWARKLARRGEALLATGVAALHPALIFNSQQARMYTLYLVLALLQSMLWLKLLKSANRRWLWGLYALLSIALLYTHYFAPLIFLSQGAWLLWQEREAMRRSLLLRRWLMATAAAFAAFAPWVMGFLFHYEDVSRGFFRWDGHFRYPLHALKEIGLQGNVFPWTWWGVVWGGGVIVLAVWGLVAQRNAAHDEKAFAHAKPAKPYRESPENLPENSLGAARATLVASQLALPFFVVWLLGPWYRLWAVRYIIFIFPWLCLAIAWGWSDLWRRWPRVLVAAICALWLLSALPVSEHIRSINRQDMQTRQSLFDHPKAR